MNYEEKKRRLEKTIASLCPNKGSVALGKNTSNLFQNGEGCKSSLLDVKSLNSVLEIDQNKLFATVEAMITYDALVKETLKYGLLPAVVPELKTITVGGALTGIGIESSSFRYGLVHETIPEFEVLLSSGKTCICSKEQNSDLFYAFPNSYGTFGYALKAKVKLVSAKPFVRLNIAHYKNAQSFFQGIEEIFAKSKQPDFVDGVVFGENTFCLILGTFTEEAPFLSDYKYLNIFYKSLEKHSIDYLTVSDYIWRWDSDWFWCSKHFFMQNKLLRLLLGKRCLNSATYWKIRAWSRKPSFFGKLLNAFSTPCETVIQDVLIPLKQSEAFIDFFLKEIPIKPIWICPAIPGKEGGKYSLFPLEEGKAYIDFGFWDRVPSKGKPPGYYNKKIEDKVKDLGGIKSLYSSCCYSKEDFWKIYNGNLYSAVKKKYDEKGLFKSLYEKCSL